MNSELWTAAVFYAVTDWTRETLLFIDILLGGGRLATNELISLTGHEWFDLKAPLNSIQPTISPAHSTPVQTLDEVTNDYLANRLIKRS